MRTSNPVFSDKVFARGRTGAGERMSMAGTVQKTGLLTLLILMSGAFTWSQMMNDQPQKAMGLAMVGLIAGLVFALIAIFKPATAPVTAPLYAIAEGLALGAISAAYQIKYAGLPVQAAGLTVFTLLAMLVLYTTGVIKVTDTFRRAVFSATLGICLFYLASLVAGFFGVTLPLIHSSGTMGILFSLFVVGVAAANLALDFDFIENGVKSGLDERMEWIGALGLVITLVSVKWNRTKEMVRNSLFGMSLATA